MSIWRWMAIGGIGLCLLGSARALADSPKISIEGDFRYRHEYIGKEGSKARTRERVRARINLEGKVSDETSVTVGISSGSPDPVSNNQTLTNAFSSKDVVLDLAFVEYAPVKIPGLVLLAGKFNNPFYKPGKSELIWDSDIRQEGGVAEYVRETGQAWFRLMGSGFWIEERSTSVNSYMIAGQGVARYALPAIKGGLALGATYYYYGNVRGFKPFFDAEDGWGNSLTEEGDYRWPFRQVEAMGELTFAAGKFPVTVMGDYINNTAADSLNDGWLTGIRIGKIKARWSWSARYIYRQLHSDAVIGIFTDSDFIGGGTDGKGHEVGGEIQVADGTFLGATYFNNTIGIDTDHELDFQRVQIDAIFEF